MSETVPSTQTNEPDLGRRAFLIAAPATALTVAIAGCSSGGSASKPAASTTTLAKGSTAESTGSQWPFYGHDLAQTRTNVAEKTITPANVAKLKRTWHVDDLVGVTGTPAAVDDVVYFADWKGQVWAVEADTGKKIWTTPVGGMFVGAPRLMTKASMSHRAPCSLVSIVPPARSNGKPRQTSILKPKSTRRPW